MEERILTEKIIEEFSEYLKSEEKSKNTVKNICATRAIPHYIKMARPLLRDGYSLQRRAAFPKLCREAR